MHAGEFQPGALYSRYIDRALTGDHDAQYVVMRALRECLRLSESREEIEELARRDLPPGAMDAITDRFRRCEDLRSKVEDPESEYDHWFGRVVASNHALVAMKGNQPEAEKRELIRTAIAQDYPEPFMYAEAYGEAATFHHTYPAYLSDPRHQAWGLLYCAHEPHCNEPSERALLRERYHDHQYDEIMEALAAIQAAIDRKDWRAIGF